MSRSDNVSEFFPYDNPYSHQKDAIQQIREGLIAGEDILFEGACGTGKTLAALTPALEYGRASDKTVIITTNVHQQTRQFIAEARAITRSTPIRAAVFRGKGDMCHIDVGYEECQVLRDTTRDLVDIVQDIHELESRLAELTTAETSREAGNAAIQAIREELTNLASERELLQTERTICDRFYRNIQEDSTDFYEWLYDDVRTPEDIFAYAEDAGYCGYELLKSGIEEVDLVICNYHHLLDPFIREHFFRWLNREPEDLIVVFDEAHNVAQAARDHASITLAEQTLNRASDEINDLTDKRTSAAKNVIETFRAALVDTYQSLSASDLHHEIQDEWHDIPIENKESRDDLTLAFLQKYQGQGFDQDIADALALGQELDRRYEQAYKSGKTERRRDSPTLTVSSFLDAWFAESGKDGIYPVIGIRNTETGPVGRAELYACLPREVTAPLFDSLHASILMSATLRPFDVTETVLGIPDPVTMAYDAQFPTDRRRTFAVDTPALFASQREDSGIQNIVETVVDDVITTTPGNTLLFFPSYAEAERYYHRYTGDSRPLLDQPGTKTETLKQEFIQSDSAALFTSLWGTLSEGVSFDDDAARSVVVVGVPYPHLDERISAVQAAYDRNFPGANAGWRYAVEIPTIRKTRQALGRIIRSPTDYGARILVDERYTRLNHHELGEYSVFQSFPAGEREEMVDVKPDKLKYALLNFFQDVDAYDTPPIID